MKAMIGMGIFQKPDMLGWFMDGIALNFPSDTVVRFYHEAFNEHSVYKDCEYLASEILPGWDFAQSGSTEHILEHGAHRHLINLFMHGECDVLIIPQDDNRFNRPLLPDLQKLWDKYGTNLGWISGRDGHGYGYSDMVCSPFSDSNADKTPLPIGDYREVLMMNTGPVVYFRHVIEKVGLPDADMPWYWWSDYSLKCHEAGLKNILLSMDCEHRKFGRVGNNPDLFKPELVARYLKTFQDRWRDKHGRNPL